jgi:hypothetical protein
VPGIRVLFVSDNLGEASAFQFGYEKHFGYTDDDVLNYFIKNKNVIKDSIQKIIIRPHPSESPNKYNWAAGRYEELVEIGGGLSLLEEIANSDIVIGGDSMAMVVALYCGKRVINCIPPNGNQSILQFDKIEKIQQLIVNNKTLHQDN